MGASGLISAADTMQLNFDGDNNAGGGFVIAKGSYLGSATAILTINNSGLIKQGIDATTYSGYVTADAIGQSIPNKKYVDDSITATVGLSSGATRLVSYFSTATGTPQNGDIRTSGSTIYIYASGAWRQVYPAVYS